MRASVQSIPAMMEAVCVYVLPHPAPLPTERERPSSAFCLLNDPPARSVVRQSKTPANDSPSPGGEGRDEGECSIHSAFREGQQSRIGNQITDRAFVAMMEAVCVYVLPHPVPLPTERERPSSAFCLLNDPPAHSVVRHSKPPANDSPSPGGEVPSLAGAGEGGRRPDEGRGERNRFYGRDEGECSMGNGIGREVFCIVHSRHGLPAWNAAR